MATPSPVDSAGLVVTEKSWPAPPVASTTCVGPHLDGLGRRRPAAGRARRRSGRPRRAGRARTSPRAPRWPSGRWRRPARARPRRRWRRRRRGRRAGREWPPSRASASEPVASRSNSTPERDQLVHAAGALVDEDPHGLLVAQPGAGGQGVGQVQVGRVLVAAEHRGDAALGPAGGRLRQRALGQDAEGQRRSARRDGSGEPDRGGQPGDAAAQDQDVEGSRPGPAWSRRFGQACSSASRRADASSITRLRPSTCTTRGT